MGTQLLRLVTAGSVDDGKSTLVGRLLHDSKSVFSDQLAALERVNQDRGLGGFDLAMLTDGLRAEREQGITIDVAYRYFATPRRTFVLADTPGHVEYTRNMVTGASTAELAVVLLDVRKGVLEQTRRHATVAALLGVRHLVLAVNKMDLVGYDEAAFAEVDGEFRSYAASHGVTDVTSIPLSALAGDNVVERSPAMPWYTGPTLLGHLETVPVGDEASGFPARFPVQYVIRTDDYRGYAGQLASGVLRVGDDVVVLPSGRRSRIAAIDTFDAPLVEAVAPMSVTVRLTGDIDVARGDIIVRQGEEPQVASELDVTLCWLADRPLRTGDRLLAKHATKVVPAFVTSITGRLDIETLAHAPATDLAVNDIGRVVLRTASPLPFDPYASNRRTGSLLLVDPHDGATLAAGLIDGGHR